MPTKLRLAKVEFTNGVVIDAETKKPVVPGDVFYDPHRLRGKDNGVRLSDRYRGTGLMNRDPIVIVLPNGQFWSPDERAYTLPETKAPVHGGQRALDEWRNSGWHGDGWTITGALPEITVTPSINTTSYHGTLTDGVLSDDLGSHVKRRRRKK